MTHQSTNLLQPSTNYYFNPTRYKRSPAFLTGSAPPQASPNWQRPYPASAPRARPWQPGFHHYAFVSFVGGDENRSILVCLWPSHRREGQGNKIGRGAAPACALTTKQNQIAAQLRLAMTGRSGTHFCAPYQGKDQIASSQRLLAMTERSGRLFSLPCQG